MKKSASFFCYTFELISKMTFEIKFFNTNLCFSFYPFSSRTNTGLSSYDMKNGLSTTVNFEGAYYV